MFTEKEWSILGALAYNHALHPRKCLDHFQIKINKKATLVLNMVESL